MFVQPLPIILRIQFQLRYTDHLALRAWQFKPEPLCLRHPPAQAQGLSAAETASQMSTNQA
ncbi:hypothetical protein DUNSADRAFT_10641 [Dunaliella salina]|uniref:Encoded protein n=1 Tax=Dunaliella salina TaxID=3046 RepID=A0ABQ7GEW4_DUNSA|nr:hypothetical protein DUNSADRAFT_10641 [Dunaliella salina]|eukprot:KAF5833152.1 hypothetical protein DUNSADRAFT_10641 [Dunaliella salina]